MNKTPEFLVLTFLLATASGFTQTVTNQFINGGTINSGVTDIITNPVTAITGAITDNGSLQFWESNTGFPNEFTNAYSVSGTGSLTQAGTGWTTLTANNSYSGPTTVNAGTLQVFSSGANFTANNPNTTYTVNSGGLLIMGNGATTAALWTRSLTINGGALQNQVLDYNDALGSLTMNGGDIYGHAYRVYDGTTWQLGGTNSISTWLKLLNFGSPAGFTLNVTNGKTTISGYISDYSGLGGEPVLKTGSGTLVLSGINSYSGETTVSGGTLSLGGGSIASQVTVTTNGVFGGNGTAGSVIVNGGGTLTATGSLSVASLTLNTNASTVLTIGSTGTNNFGSIITSANLTYNGALDFQLLNYTPVLSNQFSAFQFNGGAHSIGDFTSVQVGNTFLTDSSGLWSGIDAGVTYQFNSSTGVLTVESVPEPSTYALLGIGAIGMLMVLRRKKTA